MRILLINQMLGNYQILFLANTNRISISTEMPFFFFEHTTAVQLFSPLSGPKTQGSCEHSDMANKKKKKDKYVINHKSCKPGGWLRRAAQISLHSSLAILFLLCFFPVPVIPSFIPLSLGLSLSLLSVFLPFFPLFLLPFLHSNLSSVVSSVPVFAMIYQLWISGSQFVFTRFVVYTQINIFIWTVFTLARRHKTLEFIPLVPNTRISSYVHCISWVTD